VGVTVTFGRRPPDFVMELQSDGDFIFGLEASAALPVGITVTFRFYSTWDENAAEPTPLFIWPGTVDGAAVTWDVPRQDVAEVLSSGARHVRLRYAEADGSVLPWLRGIVNAS
jgi:hypothetical protein